MIVAKTIVGLACLLSQGVPMEKLDAEKSFSEAEKELVVAMAADGACLPETFEAHVKQTEEKILSGELKFSASSQPTRECGGL